MKANMTLSLSKIGKKEVLIIIINTSSNGQIMRLRLIPSLKRKILKSMAQRKNKLNLKNATKKIFLV